MKVDRTAFQRPTRIGNRAENFKVCRDRIDSCYNGCILLPPAPQQNVPETPA